MASPQSARQDTGKGSLRQQGRLRKIVQQSKSVELQLEFKRWLKKELAKPHRSWFTIKTIPHEEKRDCGKDRTSLIVPRLANT